jgi:hypothetical protein
MALQVLQDGKGKPAGVFIPISKWKELKKRHKDLEVLEYEEEDLDTKEQILQGIRDAVKEVNLIKAGKLKGIPAKDLLDEL